MKKENDVYCNMCGKKGKRNQDIPLEDFLYVKKTWGYFSDNDGMTHEFHLCEQCYKELIQKFQIPVTQTEEKEML